MAENTTSLLKEYEIHLGSVCSTRLNLSDHQIVYSSLDGEKVKVCFCLQGVVQVFRDVDCIKVEAIGTLHSVWTLVSGSRGEARPLLRP